MGLLLRVRLKKLAVYIDPDSTLFVALRKLLFWYSPVTLVPLGSIKRVRDRSGKNSP